MSEVLIPVLFNWGYDDDSGKRYVDQALFNREVESGYGMFTLRLRFSNARHVAVIRIPENYANRDWLEHFVEHADHKSMEKYAWDIRTQSPKNPENKFSREAPPPAKPKTFLEELDGL